MLQKILQVGNSLAITLPKDFTQSSRYKKGEEVIVETDSASGMLLMKPKTYTERLNLTPEFYQWLDQTSKKYEEVIKELARR